MIDEVLIAFKISIGYQRYVAFELFSQFLFVLRHVFLKGLLIIRLSIDIVLHFNPFFPFDLIKLPIFGKVG